MTIRYEWRGEFDGAAVNALHAAAFGHAPATIDEWDWRAQLDRHSLGWVCAHAGDELVGFVNVAWDGKLHAFVLDTMIKPTVQRLGVGRAVIAVAVERARAAGCAWLHVDFDDDLQAFYFDACGFRPTNAGLIAL